MRCSKCGAENPGSKFYAEVRRLISEREEKRIRKHYLRRETLRQQLKKTAQFGRRTGKIVPWLFQRDGKPIRDFRKAWKCACQRAGVEGKVPDDLRRTAVRNLERAGVSRASAMALVGHRSQSIYSGISVVDEAVLRESAAKLSALHRSDKGL